MAPWGWARKKVPLTLQSPKVSHLKIEIGQARVSDLQECAAILDVFQKHGHDEIDTARVYGGGSSEAYLSQLEWQKRGLVIDTKLTARKFGPKLYTHKKDGLKSGLLESLQALGADKVDTFYLHTPDVITYVPSRLALGRLDSLESYTTNLTTPITP